MCGVSGLLGAIAFGLGLHFHSWLVFLVAAAVTLTIDMLMDFCFYQLEVIKEK